MKNLFLVSALTLGLSATAFASPATPAPAPAKAPASAPAPAPAAAAAPTGPSCGQHIAAKAPLPAKSAEVMTSVADMLDAHAAYMLAGKTKEGKQEAAGLKKLSKAHRDLAARFTKLSADMTKASAWPAAPHDMAAMKADPNLSAAFQKSLAAHKELIALMQKDVAEMEAMAKK